MEAGGGKGKTWDIGLRTFEFAVAVVRLCRRLYRIPGVPNKLIGQLLNAGTSIGANVEEGQAAQSRADFITKYTIALKEVRESKYWLRLLVASEILKDADVNDLLAEVGEIGAIIGRSIVTARSNQTAKPVHTRMRNAIPS